MKSILLFALAALTLSISAAQAERKTVFRCGQSYQDSPCNGGRAIEAGDERSEAERQAAAETTRRQDELGSRLLRERLERERAQPVAGAVNLGQRAKPVRESTREHKAKPTTSKTTKTLKSNLKPVKPPQPPKGRPST